MNNRFFQIRRSVALVSLAAALVIGGALAWVINSSGHPVFGAGSPVTLRVAGNAPAGPVNLGEGFAAVVEPLLPAVVNISTSKVVKNQRGENPSLKFTGPAGELPAIRNITGLPAPKTV